MSSSINDKHVSIAKKKRERNSEDDDEYSSSPSSQRLKYNLFETGGPQVGPKIEAIIKGSSTRKKPKVVSVTIALHTAMKGKLKKGRIDSDDLGEEPRSTLNLEKCSNLVSERRRQDEKLKVEKVRVKSKQVETIKKKLKRGVIESDSGSTSDNSPISKPWMKNIKISSPITHKKEEKENAERNVVSSISRDGADRKDSQASTPPLTIPKRKKLPSLDGADEKNGEAPTRSLIIPKKKKLSNGQSNQELLSSSNGADEMESKASTVPSNIPKKKKISIGQSDQELPLPSPALKTKISRKEPEQEIKSGSHMANVPKIEKSSFLKFPSKPALNNPNTARAVDNSTQPNWENGGGGLGVKEGSASRSKMNPPQQRQLSTWVSQQQRQQPQPMQLHPPGNGSPTSKVVRQPQPMQLHPPGNGSPTKKPIRMRDSVLTESIFNDLNKIIHKVRVREEEKDLGPGKLEKLESLANNSKEVGSNTKHIEKEQSYDFFDRNDDGTIIIDLPRNPTLCDDSKVGREELPLSWWGIFPPPDNIVSMHNSNLHPSAENQERRIGSGNNTGDIFPCSQEQHQGRGNGSAHTQGYWGGREWEGQRFADGGRNNWRNNGTRRDWGNGRGRGIGGGAGNGGSGWAGVPDDRHLNASSFDRGPTRRSMR